MRKIIFLLVIPLLACSQSGPDNPAIKAEIQTVLDRQKMSWNEGNIEGFMAYYWNSEHLTFQSGNRRLRGWEKLLSRYRENFSRDGMGILDFTDIEIEVVSRDFAYVLGRWKVVQKESTDGGLFTLLFRRLDQGWRIVHDHTS